MSASDSTKILLSKLRDQIRSAKMRFAAVPNKSVWDGAMLSDGNSEVFSE